MFSLGEDGGDHFKLAAFTLLEAGIGAVGNASEIRQCALAFISPKSSKGIG